MNIDLPSLTAKKVKLAQIAAQLKTEFFGIDPCIDQVIDSIKTWYLFPDVLVRPTIIGLWGMTGVGKTALVRSLVSKLEMQGVFVEIQMDGFSGGSETDKKKVSEILKGSSIEEGTPGIVLLDEFQRYRTIDDMGRDIKVERYQDVWMLLSDGKFPNDSSKLRFITNMLADKEYDHDRNEYSRIVHATYEEQRAKEWQRLNPDQKVPVTTETFPQGAFMSTEQKEDILARQGIKISYERKFSITDPLALKIKEVLRRPESVQEIMKTWTEQRFLDELRKHFESSENRPLDYSKCLVFVSGNLDEAFKMSDSIEDCDTNADIFHDYTKKIGTVEIKRALATRFKPEQIARLGNNHVIYPSLSANAYMSIIKRSCSQYIEEMNRGVTFSVDPVVYREIYDNAVYPSQGTRPVFSSTHKLFSSPLSNAVLWALETGQKDLIIKLDVPSSSIVFVSSTNENQKLAVHVDFDIRARRESHSKDFDALVAVHEAGHAIVYAETFKTAPLEVAISLASFKGGYNRFATEHLSKAETLNRIAVSMAGIVAEEMMFGQELRSTGCASDISQATNLASSYVRVYAMDGFNSRVCSDDGYNRNLDSTNPVIEQITKDQRDVAQTVLSKHRNFLVALSNKLIEVKKMDSAKFVEFARDYIPEIKVSTNKDINGDYAARLGQVTKASQ